MLSQTLGNKHLSKLVLLVALISGFCVVGMEITASRLLAPFFGTSIFVWSSIIGVVLLCLSLGYFIGGRLAESRPSLGLLFKLTLAGGIFFLFIPKLAPGLVDFLTGVVYNSSADSFSFFALTFLSSFLMFGIPIILLAMTTPLMVKLYNQNRNRPGESAGLIFAVSTVGSIAGTIVPTFWLMPTFGVTKTVWFFAGLLALTGLFGLTFKKLLTTAALILVGVYASSLIGPAELPYKVIHASESAYHHVKVVEDSKTNRYLVFNEGLSLESVYNRSSILTGAFYDYYSLLPYLVADTDPKKVLVIGLAGATMPRQLNYFFGDSVEIDALEIDPKIVDIANEYFDLDKLKLKVIVEDGRRYLDITEKKYDVIMVDVFQNELYIPWTFTTEEFWNLVKNRLNPQGIASINVHASSNDSELLIAMANTQAKVFGQSYVTDFGFGRGYSYMLSGGLGDFDFDLASVTTRPELNGLKRAFANTQKISFDPNQQYLTDDLAPVEQLSEHSVRYYRKQKLINQ